MAHYGPIKTFVVVGLAVALAGCATTNRDWQQANRKNTIRAYEQFLQKHPDADQAGQARLHLKQLESEAAWKSAKSANTIEAYNDFLAKYPGSTHAGEAAWKSAESTNTIEALRSFLKNHATSQYAPQAEKRLESLQARQAWQSAQAANTVEAFKAFLKKYGASPYAADAKAHLERVERENAWAKAKTADTQPAYEAYLKKYANSRHADEARKRLTAIYRAYLTGFHAVITTAPQIFSREVFVVQPWKGRMVNGVLTGAMQVKTSFSRKRPKKGSAFVIITWRVLSKHDFKIPAPKVTETVNGHAVPCYMHPWQLDSVKRNIEKTWSKSQLPGLPQGAPFMVVHGQESLQFLYAVPRAKINDAMVRFLGHSHRLTALLHGGPGNQSKW